MSELDSRFVKRGLWTNVDKGLIMGNTITTDYQAGTMVVALLAILAAMATTNLWNLVAFSLHQIRADGRPADGLFRQQQVLLRQLPTPSTLLADTIKLWLFWRSKVERALTRSLVHLMLGLLFFAGSVAVGVFSSFIVDSTNLQVLVNSPLCGPLDLDPTDQNYSSKYDGVRPWEAKVAALGKAYAEDCYQDTIPRPTRCNTFTQPNINFTKNLVTCPFDPSICFDMEFPALCLDSGLIDLNHGFGMNLATNDRVKHRRKTTCGILETEGHTSIVPASDYSNWSNNFVDEELLLMHYGPKTIPDEPVNGTFVTSLAKANISFTYNANYQTAYENPEWATMNDFKPIPELQQDNADIVLVMLAKNSVAYAEPVNDPVFAAHKSYEVIDWWNKTKNQYYSDFPTSILGCTQQYQFCFARNNAPDYCTPLTYLPGKVLPSDYPGASPIQLAVLQLLITSSLIFDISDAALSVLKVADLVGGTEYITSLPDDQWVQEVAGWESFIWATLQTAVTDFAIGPAVREPSIKGSVRTGSELTAGERELCGAQKMKKSGGFVTINTFGLTLITTFALFVAILDFVILRVVIVMSRFRRALAPKIDRWIQDSAFQLQRQAYEGRGEGEWEAYGREIPVTVGRDKLGELALASCSGVTLGDGKVHMRSLDEGVDKMESVDSLIYSMARERPETPPSLSRLATDAGRLSASANS